VEVGATHAAVLAASMVACGNEVLGIDVGEVSVGQQILRFGEVLDGKVHLAADVGKGSQREYLRDPDKSRIIRML
jgi:hypothetical protein